MLVAYDDRLTEHLAGVEHLERPGRVRVVARELEWGGCLTNASIRRSHDPMNSHASIRRAILSWSALIVAL
jgi:hypothetical protein